MTLWILGKNGQLAKALKLEALKRAHPHICTGKNDLNLLDQSQLISFIQQEKITSIINASAYTNVELSEKEDALAFLVNKDIPKMLSLVSKKYHIPVTHFSTDYVFDGKKKTPYTEEDPPNPLNIYGKSKLAGEEELLKAPLTLIIRTSWLMGFKGNNFIETLLKKAKTVNELKIVNDQIGKVTFCHDLAKATFDLQGHTGLFHFANEGELSWYDLAKLLPLPCKILPISSDEYPQIAKRPSYSALSLNKIKRVLPYEPRPFKIPLEEYLNLCVN
jgi:dTDP-4-dehydrorhamnose reductase